MFLYREKFIDNRKTANRIIHVMYYKLIRLQDVHRKSFDSVIRTWTMMLGDIGFSDMFHSNFPSEEVRYPPATYAMFILFLLLSIIIANIWVRNISVTLIGCCPFNIVITQDTQLALVYNASSMSY